MAAEIYVAKGSTTIAIKLYSVVYDLHKRGIRIRIFASRQCADCTRTKNAGAGEARVACVMFANLLYKLFGVVVSKLRWPCVPDLHLHHQRTTNNI